MTSQERKGANGELSGVKIFFLRILITETRGIQPPCGSWPYPAGNSIDVFVAKLFTEFHIVFLSTCSKYVFEFIDTSNQTTGRIRPSTIHTQAIPFSLWAFLHSIKECGLDVAQYRYVCLFGDCFRTNHFSSDQITLINHSSSKLSQKMHAANLDFLLAGLKHCVRCGFYAFHFRFFLKILQIASQLKPSTLAACLTWHSNFAQIKFSQSRIWLVSPVIQKNKTAH